MKRKSLIFRRVFIMGVMLALIGQACTFTLFKNPFETTPAVQTPVEISATGTPQPVAQTNFIAVSYTHLDVYKRQLWW